MYKTFRSSVILTLIVALILIPLYGVMAMTNAGLSAVDIKSENTQSAKSDNKQASQLKPSCEHCKKNDCREKHQCNNGQCATTNGVLLSCSINCQSNLTDSKCFKYTVGLVISPLTSLYRPPKKILSQNM